MNSRQKTIIRVLQLIFYPIAAIMVIAFVWNFYVTMTGQGDVEILTEADRTPGTDWVAVVVVGLFWIVFLALLIEFLAREILRRNPRDHLGKPLVEIGRVNSALRFLPVIVMIPFVAGLNLILLQPETLDIDPGRISLPELMAFWLFHGVAHFLLVAFLLRAIRNRPFFVLTSKGFLYEPGDLSPGLIRWEDVTEIREAELLSGQGAFAGPATRRTLVVGLRNPDAHRQRYTPLLGLLQKLSARVVSFQTDGPGDVVIFADDLGSRYEEVRDLMLTQAKATGGGR